MAAAPEARIRPELLDRTEQLAECRLALVSAPGGSGKTTLLRAWQRQLHSAGEATAWIALDPAHADAAVWTEDLIDALRDSEGGSLAAPAQQLQRELPHVDPSQPAILARQLRRALRGVEAPTTLFLDNYHLLSGAGADVVDALLRDEAPGAARIVIATRGARPPAAARLISREQCVLVDADDLSLRADQVDAMLRDRGLDAADEIVPQLLATTGGWATGVLLAARKLANAPKESHDQVVSGLSSASDLFAYVADDLLAEEDPAVVELLELASLAGNIDAKLLASAGQHQNARDALHTAVEHGLLLRDGDRVQVHHLWQELLRSRLREQLSPEAWQALHRRLGDALAPSAPDRAVEIYRDGEVADALATLLETHGLGWYERGRRGFVADALARVPTETRRERPTLHLLDTLHAMPRDVDAGLDALAQLAARMRELGDYEAEGRVLHRGLICAGNENRMEWVARFGRQLMSFRRLFREPGARALARFGLAVGALAGGRYSQVERLIEGVDWRTLSDEERGAPLHALSMIRRYTGEWDRGRAEIDEALEGRDAIGFPPAIESMRVQRALFTHAKDRDTEFAVRECESARDALRDFGLTVSEAIARATLAHIWIDVDEDERALAELDEVIALNARIRQWDREAHARCMRASIHLRRGRLTAARDEAAKALALHEAAPSRAKRLSPFSWEVVYAAWLLAEAGDIEHATSALAGTPSAREASRLPLIRHATRLCRARVAFLADDAGAAQQLVREAWDAAEQASLRYFAPELTRPLLEWGAGMASDLDVATGYLHERGLVRESAPAISIDSLGRFAVRLAGREVSTERWRGAQTRRLLLRLLVAGERGETRERLEADLWPDLAAEKARNNLRVTLSRLRGALEADTEKPWIHAEAGRIALSAECFAGWDVTRVRAALADDDRPLEPSLAAYAGPFVPELYDDWAEAARREIESEVVSGTLRRAEGAIEAGSAADAVSLLRRVTAIAPAEEDLWERRIEAELAAGDAASAHASYELAAATLTRELGAPPEATLSRMREQIRGARRRR